jgi:hypothetical protein
MTINNNGVTGFPKGPKRTSQEIMELYDATPKEYRDVLKYAVANIVLKNPEKAVKTYGTPKKMKSFIKRTEVIGTRDTYGRSHPDFAY